MKTPKCFKNYNFKPSDWIYYEEIKNNSPELLLNIVRECIEKSDFLQYQMCELFLKPLNDYNNILPIINFKNEIKNFQTENGTLETLNLLECCFENDPELCQSIIDLSKAIKRK